MNGRKILEQKGWLEEAEDLIVPRLRFQSIDSNSAPLISEHNKSVRDLIFRDILSQGISPTHLVDPLTFEKSEDILIAEIDRYGLPLRTVINKETGLIRSTPYYNEVWLNNFYSKYYRELYSNKNSLSYASILAEQIYRGDDYYKYIEEYLKPQENILEIGCGMGGVLISFKLNGYKVHGIDLGPEFVKIGSGFNLNLLVNSIDDVIASNEKYSLVIFSHLLEHIIDIENFITKVKLILKPDGKIFIAVPGIKKIHQTYHSNIHIYLQNAHAWSFSQKTLSALLVRNGFNILKSDEYINCLAELGESPDKIDLINESDEIISYIKKTEEYYLASSKIKKLSFFKRIKNKIKRIYNN